ncbi:uncharacterized protein [Nicotiana tomentosiformis]|uniref:uncharacterized protein n=1 Tax=Nicotiana tomentosiformis TaxID=4098 RepID=UPI0014452B02|nr:uncharacterized protein LOC117278303 [Nicotiana tomentosiformis]
MNRGQAYKDKRSFIVCEYCNMKEHSKENCYKLVEYPANFKQKKKGPYGNENVAYGNGNTAGQASYRGPASYGGQPGNGKQPFAAVNNASSNMESQTQAQHSLEGVLEGKIPHFTEEQYNQILNLLNKDARDNTQVNMTGALQWQSEGDW